MSAEVASYYEKYNVTDYKGPKFFKTEEDMEDYITDSDYLDEGRQRICFGVVLEYQSAPEELTMRIRFNTTDTDPDDSAVYGTWYEIFSTSY